MVQNCLYRCRPRGLFGCCTVMLGYGSLRTSIYAWNPLVLYSFAGGGHYDSWFVLSLVITWFACEPIDHQGDLAPWRKPWAAGLAGLSLGISIAIKWLSLPIVAYYGWRLLRHRQWWGASLFILGSALPMAISALPFCSLHHCPLIPADSAFVVQGRSAELLPYGLSLLWPSLQWHNAILLIPCAIALLWLVRQSTQMHHFTQEYLGILLILSPIVHAWYFTWLIPFAVARNHWGARWISLSAFIYFVLPYREGLGQTDWLLTPLERLGLWAPFLLGWIWTHRYQHSQPVLNPYPVSSQ
ncbi:MAG: hypothetical protein HC792_05175 [Acaryochloridaceae cyanobacterium CSU_5_19]|nr:hypothetical protein [Acaryochloridaceae cyanobacterium CSU_5_19]